MSSTQKEELQQRRKAVIGTSSNFWLHSSRDDRFDLTHPSSPTTDPISPRLDITTTTTPITVDPSKTALVIIDMQNFFLSSAFGRHPDSAGLIASSNLVTHAIPAARKAGIRIIWLNWGLSDDEVAAMPPAVKRAFGFEAIIDEDGATTTAKTHPDGDEFKEEAHIGSNDEVLFDGKNARIYKGLGSDCGTVFLADGTAVDGGRLLMRGSWNAALHAPLDSLYEEGRALPHNPDVWIHKNRMSGLWGASTACEEFLEHEGLRTLLFAGVNTDQCVSGTYTDAFSKGYDCVLLSDGCGTTSPRFAQEGIEYNAAKTWGFLVGCEEFAKGVNAMKR